MNSHSLLQYLSVALPTIPVQVASQTPPNTSNPRHGPEDVTEVSDWPEFNYATIIHRYGGILNSKEIAPHLFGSPALGIVDEQHFQARWCELLIPRVRRALRAGFEELAPWMQQLGLVPITVDGGSAAAYFDQYRPDIAFIIPEAIDAETANRAPGDTKVSWKWHSDLRHEQRLALQRQYKKVLSELNFYMGQYRARHGFVLTNTELVAVKRLDTNGRLAVSSSIPWTAGGHGQLTVLMGLWYLGMLAAEESNWTL